MLYTSYSPIAWGGASATRDPVMRQERKAEFAAAAIEANAVTVATPLRHRVRVPVPFHLIESVVPCAEFVLVVGTSVVAGVAYHAFTGSHGGNIVAFLGIGALVFINFFAIGAFRGNYKPQALTDFWDQVREVTAAWFSVCLLLLALAFSLKISDSYSRGATLTFFAAGWGTLILWRALLARSIGAAFAVGGFTEQRIVILATEGEVLRSGAAQELRRCGYKPVRSFEVKPDDVDANGLTAGVKSLLEDLIETCRRERVEQVYLAIPWAHRRLIDGVMAGLRVLSIPIHLLPDDNVAHFLDNRIVGLGTTWTAELKRAPLFLPEQAMKRTVDLVLASAGLIILAPLMIIVAAMVRLESTGPVFFVQTRNGFNGRTFGVRKFRTMHVTEDGPVIRQATRNDPRVTRVGRLLRRTNIDELPQLFNVIAGDMSLVGPRPHAVAHNSEYQKLIGTYAFRYHMKPGITGWAQINGFRGETQTVDMMARRVEYDLWYINNWSLWLDVKILFKTLMIGIQPNAY